MMKLSKTLFLLALSTTGLAPVVTSKQSWDMEVASSLPLDDANLTCPLPTIDLGEGSGSCDYNDDCKCLTACGPIDGYTGKFYLPMKVA